MPVGAARLCLGATPQFLISKKDEIVGYSCGVARDVSGPGSDFRKTQASSAGGCAGRPTARIATLPGVPEPVREGSREALKVARAATPTHEHLRSRLVFLFVATVVLGAVASVLIFMFERHATGTEIKTFGDSVFWTSTQLLTVSSQLPNPISSPARVLDVFLQAYAISAVAILAGSFGAFFHRRGMERDPPNHVRGSQAPE
jgi:hypothetical protein